MQKTAFYRQLEVETVPSKLPNASSFYLALAKSYTNPQKLQDVFKEIRANANKTKVDNVHCSKLINVVGALIKYGPRQTAKDVSQKARDIVVSDNQASHRYYLAHNKQKKAPGHSLVQALSGIWVMSQLYRELTDWLHDYSTAALKSDQQTCVNLTQDFQGQLKREAFTQLICRKATGQKTIPNVTVPLVIKMLNYLLVPGPVKSATGLLNNRTEADQAAVHLSLNAINAASYLMK